MYSNIKTNIVLIIFIFLVIFYKLDYKFLFEKYNLWTIFYDKLAELDFLETMNWGYVSSYYHKNRIPYYIMKDIKLTNINSVNLYHIVIFNALKFNKKIENECNVCDIGCGTGGGLNFIANNFSMKSLIGYDISQKAINLANNKYKNNRINFVKRDIRKIQLNKNKMDIIINIESYHCYGYKSNFFKNIYNMLENDGIFTMADYVNVNNLKFISEDCKNYFNLLKVIDISDNVINSLKCNIRKEDIIEGVDKLKNKYPYIPQFIINKAIYDFSGKANYDNMKKQKNVYFIAIFQKRCITTDVIIEQSKKLRLDEWFNKDKELANKKYISETFRLKKIICNDLFNKPSIRSVTILECPIDKISIFEPFVTLSHTSPYIYHDYMNKSKLNYGNKYKDYMYQTYTPPDNCYGIEPKGKYHASEFKKLLKPYEYIINEVVPYANSYDILKKSKANILKDKMESYYYGSKSGSKLHSDNTYSYSLQLKGSKQWYIYESSFVTLLNPINMQKNYNIYIKDSNDNINKNIPKLEVVVKEGDLLIVPYGIPHEVKCIKNGNINTVSEHINYRGLSKPLLYKNNNICLYKSSDQKLNFIRNYFSYFVIYYVQNFKIIGQTNNQIRNSYNNHTNEEKDFLNKLK